MKYISTASLGLGLLLATQHSALAQRTATPAAKAPAAKTSASTPALEQAIQQYIMDHPEVVLESVKRFQARYQETQREQARATVATHQRELTADAANPMAQGAQQGEPVTIVEFFDYRCGYCKKMAETITQLSTAPGVRVVYKDLPILGPESVLASQAALAAAKQGKHQAFHEALLHNTAPITPELLAQLATTLGLDPAKLKVDMASPEVAATLARNQELAGKLNIQSTPTFVIGNDIHPGALSAEAFQPLIQAARQQATAAVPTSMARR